MQGSRITTKKLECVLNSFWGVHMIRATLEQDCLVLSPGYATSKIYDLFFSHFLIYKIGITVDTYV